MAATKNKTAKKPTKKTKAKASKKNKSAAKSEAPVPVSESDIMRPLMGLRDQIEDMFDRYMQGWPRLGQLAGEVSLGLKGFERIPSVDMTETDGGYAVTAELPGMGEGDLDVSVVGDMLTISGEKKEEHEEKKKDYYLQERRYGKFRRSLRLPDDGDTNKISASFDKGVLTVDIPRTGEPKKKGRKITVGKA